MYQRILVPLDGSTTSDSGLTEAIRIAGVTGGCLRLMHAIDDLSLTFALESSMAYASNWQDYMREDGEAVLARGRKVVEAAGIQCESFLSDSFAFPVYERIANEARRWDADLIVIGTHGRRGFQRWAIGSTAEGVLRHASTPVLLVRAPEQEADATPPAEPADRRLATATAVA